MKNFIPLSPGRTITIGRNPSCDVVIDSPLVSGKHCKVNFTHHTEAVAVVSDCSKNGTWIGRSVKEASTNASRSPSSVKFEKLVKEKPKDIRVGDAILLLAPGHEQSLDYRYRLVLDKDGKCSLRQWFSLAEGSSNGSNLVASVKRRRSEVEESEPIKKARHIMGTSEACTFTEATSTEQPSDEEDKERCPSCRKLFPVSILPMHCPACQEHAVVKPGSVSFDTTQDVMEECSRCRRILPSAELAGHLPTCEGVVEDTDSYGECPYCLNIFTVVKLIEHSGECRKSFGEEVEVDGGKRLLCANGSEWKAASADTGRSLGGGGGGGDDMLELEQCAFCLEDFPLCEMPAHYSECTAKSKVKCPIL